MQGDCAARKAMSFPRVMRLRNRTWPAASAPCAWNTCFAMSNPIVVTCAMDASFSDGSTPSPWHADAVRGRPPHHSLVERRLGKEGLQLLFGRRADQRALVDDVISVCGGHFRDLLRLLRDMLVRATSLANLPVPHAVVASTINAARRDFLPIAQDDARWLAEIASVRATDLPDTEPATVNRLARFLDSHFVFYLVNADEWYDIHPLIRDEVDEVVQAAAAIPS